MTDKIEPMANRILVERTVKEQKISGILIPDSCKDKQFETIVIKTGEGKRNEKGEIIPMKVKAGDKILTANYGFQVIRFEEKDYMMMTEDEVIAIIHE